MRVLAVRAAATLRGAGRAWRVDDCDAAAFRADGALALSALLHGAALLCQTLPA